MVAFAHRRNSGDEFLVGSVRSAASLPFAMRGFYGNKEFTTTRYHRWYAGWPSFTATKAPRQVAQSFPPAVNVPSIVARSSAISTTFADKKTESFVDVGRSIFIAFSAVTVQGGRSSPARFIR